MSTVCFSWTVPIPCRSASCGTCRTRWRVPSRRLRCRGAGPCQTAAHERASWCSRRHPRSTCRRANGASSAGRSRCARHTIRCARSAGPSQSGCAAVPLLTARRFTWAKISRATVPHDQHRAWTLTVGGSGRRPPAPARRACSARPIDKLER